MNAVASRRTLSTGSLTLPTTWPLGECICQLDQRPHHALRRWRERIEDASRAVDPTRLHTRGLGSDPDEVASPTFVLLTAYPGRITLHHADLYRLGRPGEDADLGLEELPGPRGVLAVEWAERLGDCPWARVHRVRLEHAGEDTRRIAIEAPPG